jgi:hypothetical protein
MSRRSIIPRSVRRNRSDLSSANVSPSNRHDEEQQSEPMTRSLPDAQKDCADQQLTSTLSDVLQISDMLSEMCSASQIDDAISSQDESIGESSAAIDMPDNGSRAECISPTVYNATDEGRASQIASNELQHPMQPLSPGWQSPADVSEVSDQAGQSGLADQVVRPLRESISELQQSHTASLAVQTEVLKDLAELIRQSVNPSPISAPTEQFTELIQRSMSEMETRLLERLAFGASSGSANSVSSGTTATVPYAEKIPAPSVKLQRAASTVARSWEQIRNELMEKGEIGEATPAPEQLPAVQLPEISQLTSDRHFRLPEQDPLLEIPASVNSDIVSHDELKTAFREREAFIATLVARIRRQQELATSQLSHEQLRGLVSELPDALAAQVRYTLRQMDDLVRMSELELSLERARIARQVNQLEHSRQILEHNARQLGMQLNADGAIINNQASIHRSSSNRRWLGKLGFGQ